METYYLSNHSDEVKQAFEELLTLHKRSMTEGKTYAGLDTLFEVFKENKDYPSENVLQIINFYKEILRNKLGIKLTSSQSLKNKNIKMGTKQNRTPLLKTITRGLLTSDNKLESLENTLFDVSQFPVDLGKVKNENGEKYTDIFAELENKLKTFQKKFMSKGNQYCYFFDLLLFIDRIYRLWSENPNYAKYEETTKTLFYEIEKEEVYKWFGLTGASSHQKKPLIRYIQKLQEEKEALIYFPYAQSPKNYGVLPLRLIDHFSEHTKEGKSYFVFRVNILFSYLIGKKTKFIQCDPDIANKIKDAMKELGIFNPKSSNNNYMKYYIQFYLFLMNNAHPATITTTNKKFKYIPVNAKIENLELKLGLNELYKTYKKRYNKDIADEKIEELEQNIYKVAKYLKWFFNKDTETKRVMKFSVNPFIFQNL